MKAKEVEAASTKERACSLLSSPTPLSLSLSGQEKVEEANRKSMCNRLVNAIHSFTFHQKKSEPSMSATAAAKGDASRTGGEEAISTHGKVVELHSSDQRSKPQAAVGSKHSKNGHAEKPKRSHSINKKVDDFIARTKMKMRSASGISVGRHPPPPT